MSFQKRGGCIYGNAFSECGLRSISFTGGSCYFDKEAFARNASLASVTVTGGYVDFGEKTFSDCSSLKSFTVTGGTVEIRSGTFSGCTGLTSVTLPSTIRLVDNAFKDCSSLKTLYIRASDDTPAEWNTNCGLSGNARIIVSPNSKVSEMREEWYDVAEQITGIYQLKALECDHV